MDQDQEHLRLLSLFHYIVGGLGGLFACFPIFHVIMGFAILNGAFPNVLSFGHRDFGGGSL